MIVVQALSWSPVVGGETSVTGLTTHGLQPLPQSSDHCVQSTAKSTGALPGGGSHLVTGKIHSVTGKTHPVTGKTHPVTGKNSPSQVKTHPVTGKTHPARGKTHLITDKNHFYWKNLIPSHVKLILFHEKSYPIQGNTMSLVKLTMSQLKHPVTFIN